MTDDARERFLREITAQVPADRIAELHLFPPHRRGGTETGVAVIAAELADMVPGTPAAKPGSEHGVEPGTEPGTEHGDAVASPPATGAPTPRTDRLTVFTARYRLTRKGADRGKWEFDVVADADAPLRDVDTVVRGVQRRSGDNDEPERLTADGVRAALDGTSWQPAT